MLAANKATKIQPGYIVLINDDGWTLRTLNISAIVLLFVGRAFDEQRQNVLTESHATTRGRGREHPISLGTQKLLKPGAGLEYEDSCALSNMNPTTHKAAVSTSPYAQFTFSHFLCVRAKSTSATSNTTRFRQTKKLTRTLTHHVSRTRLAELAQLTTTTTFRHAYANMDEPISPKRKSAEQHDQQMSPTARLAAAKGSTLPWRRSMSANKAAENMKPDQAVWAAWNNDAEMEDAEQDEVPWTEVNAFNFTEEELSVRHKAGAFHAGQIIVAEHYTSTSTKRRPLLVLVTQPGKLLAVPILTWRTKSTRSAKNINKELRPSLIPQNGLRPTGSQRSTWSLETKIALGHDSITDLAAAVSFNYEDVKLARDGNRLTVTSTRRMVREWQNMILESMKHDDTVLKTIDKEVRISAEAKREAKRERDILQKKREEQQSLALPINVYGVLPDGDKEESHDEDGVEDEEPFNDW